MSAFTIKSLMKLAKKLDVDVGDDENESELTYLAEEDEQEVQVKKFFRHLMNNGYKFKNGYWMLKGSPTVSQEESDSGYYGLAFGPDVEKRAPKVKASVFSNVAIASLRRRLSK